jgi:parallel beta-helix repeat protein
MPCYCSAADPRQLKTTPEKFANRLISPQAMWRVALLLVLLERALVAAPVSQLPLVEVRTFHVTITQSCRIVIPSGTIISDRDDTGAIRVGADDIELDFVAGAVLRGSATNASPDQYKSYGIRIDGHKRVTIRGAWISGSRCGLWAKGSDGLTLENLNASDNRRAFLKSTPLAEDESDWLYGHDNDQHEWLERYGAALYLERSVGVTVRDCQVWHGQNALCLDRVTGSKVYDNDFSFNSGWGLASWRCSSNVISRNAFDFCVRGYSHGVYNRGQDSAGVFAFEQNNGNVFVENSVTHGGDGFFGFAGREALGQTGVHPVSWYRRRGNTDNVLARNDFSYAAAHGIENTFSFGNRYLDNRIVGNAICGIWAGYSRQTLIAGNDLQNNGEMGYGLERGGVNIDHGGDNQILGNRFASNKCGVHLWGGANPEFEKKPWAQANGYASTGSVIADNTFDDDALGFQFRGPGEVTLGSNALTAVTRTMLADPAYHVRQEEGLAPPQAEAGSFPVPGSRHPVGARAELRGRENIIMTEWGPWDHQTPLVRRLKSTGGSVVYQALKVPADRLEAVTHDAGVSARIEGEPGVPDRANIVVSAAGPGLFPFHLTVKADGKPLAESTDTLIAANWQVTFFKWPTEVDPRQRLGAYRELASAPGAVSVSLNQLSFKYGMRGPSDLGLSDSVTAGRLGRDHFGMIARTQLPLKHGMWQFTTESDDGVRVSVDGKPVIENWTWHGPTRDNGTLNLPADKTVVIEVEHFQIDGYAVLDFSVAPGGGRASQ